MPFELVVKLDRPCGRCRKREFKLVTSDIDEVASFSRRLVDDYKHPKENKFVCPHCWEEWKELQQVDKKKRWDSFIRSQHNGQSAA